MHGAIPPLPQYSFMAWCLVKSMEFTNPISIVSMICSSYSKDLSDAPWIYNRLKQEAVENAIRNEQEREGEEFKL
jgi:hypothetical protein